LAQGLPCFRTRFDIGIGGDHVQLNAVLRLHGGRIADPQFGHVLFEIEAIADRIEEFDFLDHVRPIEIDRLREPGFQKVDRNGGQ